MRYFVGKGAILWPLNLLGQAVGLVSTIIYARFLTPEQYGQFSFVFATVTLVSFLGLPGMNTALAQAAARGEDGFFRVGTAARLRFSLWGSGVVGLVAVGVWYAKGAAVGQALVVAAALFPVFYAMDGYWSILTGKKQFERVAALRVTQMGGVAVTTWLAVWLTQSVPVVFAANFGVTALTNWAFYRWTARRWTQADACRAESLGYGQRLSWLSVLMSIEARVDHVLLGLWLPFQALGWFNMADRISDAVMKGTWSVTAQMLFPRLAEASPQESRRRVRVWGLYLVGGFVVLAVVFCALAGLLVWLLGEKYAASVTLARWLVVIAAISVPWSIFEVYCQARGAERSLWITRLTVTLTHLATLPVLMKMYGLTGVLVSMGISRVVCVAVCAWLFAREKASA